LGARTGADFLARIRQNPRELWHNGERVADPTEHTAFKRGLGTLASLYDRQWENEAACLYDPQTHGQKVGRSFLVPRTREELQGVGKALSIWEETTYGWMGRLPTYLNRASTSFAAAARYFAEVDPAYGKNVTSHYEYMRDNDLCLSSTFSTPQFNRGAKGGGEIGAEIVAHVKKETDAGLVIAGCKTLATLPVADELLVYSGAPLRNPEKDMNQAFVFAIPSHTPGLKFLCRESLDDGKSAYDRPLSSRFEENDAVVIFDDVLVPWDRVFMYRDIPRCNGAFTNTGAAVHMDYQNVIKNIARTEFLLGLISLMVNSISIEVYQHIYQKLAEVWVVLETMKAFRRTSEADAEIDEWGVMRPAADPLLAASMVYSQSYPRLIEIIHQIGASGLIMTPTKGDMDGPLVEDIKRYYQAARAEAFDKIPLFRLAWDVSLSAFGSRQVLYERFSRGDPIRVANAMVISRKDQFQMYADRVSDFVRQNKDIAHSSDPDGS
jgi:4-hydroxyphenylacetate 3-monooxygenase